VTGVLKCSQNYVDVRFVVWGVVMLIEVRSVLAKEMYRAVNISEP